MKSYRTKNWHYYGKEMNIYLKINLKKKWNSQQIWCTMFLGNLLLSLLFMIHKVCILDIWPSHRAFHQFGLQQPFFCPLFWPLSVASLVFSMPGLMVTKPSHHYSHMEQAWLFVVLSKCSLSSGQVWAPHKSAWGRKCLCMPQCTGKVYKLQGCSWKQQQDYKSAE